jgi:hypothetical protein
MVAILFIFLAVVLLGFYLFWMVIFSDYVIYPIDNMGTTSVFIIEIDYINPWFFLFEFPFVAIGAGAAFAIGSQFMSKGWEVVGGYIILALTLVGVCLYTTLYFLTYNLIYQLVPQNIIPAETGYDTHMFIQSAISNGTVLSRYFWTAFSFVVAGAVMGLLGSYISRKKRAPNHTMPQQK